MPNNGGWAIPFERRSWMTRQETAKFLRIHERSLDRLLTDGTLKADKYLNRWMIPKINVFVYREQLNRETAS